jgi:hypothetical protein
MCTKIKKTVSGMRTFALRARNDTLGQSMIEFSFAMIAIVFIIYSMVQMFRWAGMDLAQRRYLMDSGITNDLQYPDSNGDPAAQLNFTVEGAQPMAAFYHGSITDNSQ